MKFEHAPYIVCLAPAALPPGPTNVMARARGRKRHADPEGGGKDVLENGKGENREDAGSTGEHREGLAIKSKNAPSAGTVRVQHSY